MFRSYSEANYRFRPFSTSSACALKSERRRKLSMPQYINTIPTSWIWQLCAIFLELVVFAENAFAKLQRQYEEKFASGIFEVGAKSWTHHLPTSLCIFGDLTVLFIGYPASFAFASKHTSSHSLHYVRELFLRFISLFAYSHYKKFFFPAPPRWFAENKSMNLIPVIFLWTWTIEALSNWQYIFQFYLVKCRFGVVHMSTFGNNGAMPHKTCRMPCVERRIT